MYRKLTNDFRFININDWTTILISGSQILEYLNGIVTFDLEKLENEKITRNLFLTPHAKIRSLFWMKKTSDGYYIYSPPVFRENLITDLLKFKLDMNIKLEDIGQERPPLYLKQEENGDVKIGDLRFNFEYHSEIPPKGIISDNFNNFLIAHGELPFEYYLDQNPFETGLNDAVTLDKGCFLGQEPLSRMYHRGKPRKFLYLIELSHFSGTSYDLLKNDEKVGQILVTNDIHPMQQGIAYLNSSVTEFAGITHEGNEIQVLRKIGHYPVINR